MRIEQVRIEKESAPTTLLSEDVDRYKAHYKEMFLAASSSFPDLPEVFTFKDRKRNERGAERLLNDLEAGILSAPSGKEARET